MLLNASQQTRADRKDAHKAKMKRKASQRPTLTAGFEPIFNKKLSGAFTGIMATLAAQYPRWSPAELHNAAMREFRKMLPPARRSRSLEIRPSKSDDLAYRLGGNFDKATGKALRANAAAA